MVYNTFRRQCQSSLHWERHFIICKIRVTRIFGLAAIEPVIESQHIALGCLKLYNSLVLLFRCGPIWIDRYQVPMKLGEQLSGSFSFGR